jgi:hypothetical protein
MEVSKMATTGRIEKHSNGEWKVVFGEGCVLYTATTKKACMLELPKLEAAIAKRESEISQAAATLGARGGAVGGLSTSPAKAAASRTNGKLGGRPRKQESVYDGEASMIFRSRDEAEARVKDMLGWKHIEIVTHDYGVDVPDEDRYVWVIKTEHGVLRNDGQIM